MPGVWCSTAGGTVCTGSMGIGGWPPIHRSASCHAFAVSPTHYNLVDLLTSARPSSLPCARASLTLSSSWYLYSLADSVSTHARAR